MFMDSKIKKALAVGSTAVFLAIGGRVLPANAAKILSPVSATASSTVSSTFAIDYTIDRSGLSQTFTSGVTDFDTYIGLNPNHLASSTSFLVWLAVLGVNSATIIYDLGMPYTLDRFALWNPGFAGIGSLDVFTSSDGISYTSVASGLNPTNNPNGVDFLADIFPLGSSVARFVRLEASGCPQSDASYNGCAMGEIAFSVNPASSGITTPEPSALLGLGLLGLSLVSKRQFGGIDRQK